MRSPSRPGDPQVQDPSTGTGNAGFGGTGVGHLVGSLATRLRPDEGLTFPTGYVEDWRRLRADLDKRRESRRSQRRLRRDPTNYLSQLEKRSLQASLPT